MLTIPARDADEAIARLVADPAIERLVTAHRVLEPRPPRHAPWPDELADAARRGRVTLVHGARDEEHNQAVVLAGEIERRLKG